MALELSTSANVLDSLFKTKFIQPAAPFGKGDGLIGKNSGKGVVSLLPSQDQVTISDLGRKAAGLLDQTGKLSSQKSSPSGLGKELPSPIPEFKTTDLSLSQERNLGITRLKPNEYFFKKSLQWLVNNDQRGSSFSLMA